MISFGGDYYITQSSLLLSALVDGDITLKNCNRSRDTDATLSFLASLGIRATRKDSEIRIETAERPVVPDDQILTFDGSIFPLSLIIGLLAGINRSCSVRYTESINQDVIDNIVEALNTNGIDVTHEADSRVIVIRAGTDYPLEVKLCSSLSHLKNCLLMFGAASGRSVSIREVRTTSESFQKCLGTFGGSIRVDKQKPVLKEDPGDPRRKVRVRSADYRREIILPASTELHPIDFDIPGDAENSLALMTLAVLKKKDIRLENVALDSRIMRFLNYLKSSDIEATVIDRRSTGGETVGTICVQKGEIKVRKISGEQASTLIDEIPFLAVLAALGSGTSLIRGVREFSDWGIAPFQEIADSLGRMGIKCGILEDGLAIEGTGEITGADFGTFENPKVALAFYVAALAGQGASTFENFMTVRENYPDFVEMMENVSADRTVFHRES